MTKINRLSVVIEPWDYGPGRDMQLRITLQVDDGLEVGMEKIIPRNEHFRSLWDYIWDSAGEEVKRRFDGLWEEATK